MFFNVTKNITLIQSLNIIKLKCEPISSSTFVNFKVILFIFDAMLGSRKFQGKIKGNKIGRKNKRKKNE